MSKKSVAELSVTAVDSLGRIAPVSCLTPPQKAVWVKVVNARPADWFGEEHIELLKQYCRHSVQSDILADEISKFDPKWLDDEEGLKRWDKLHNMQDRETKAINTLARSMRLTQQSLIRADKVVKSQKAKKPWES